MHSVDKNDSRLLLTSARDNALEWRSIVVASQALSVFFYNSDAAPRAIATIDATHTVLDGSGCAFARSSTLLNPAIISKR